MREALETSGARLAALRRTEADLTQLDALLERRETAWESGDAERFVEADASLHLGVLAASHNDVLTALYADLGDVMRDFLRLDVGAELEESRRMDHARLIDAIHAGDAEAAAREAAGHTQEWRCGEGRARGRAADGRTPRAGSPAERA
jgi:DNA-binding FadR family transcriptional regulator